ncbi:MAG: IS110 family transposase, partial [Eubacterium sp.]|nr:IS110 family transposase [Eubacterium sp.]
MAAVIVAEVGDFHRFASPDKLLAYAGLSPTTYQSGQLISSHAKMEKRGSRYLRYALFNATMYVCVWDPTFRAYLEKKRTEGKHYNVAVSHAAKKLVRLIYHLETTGETYVSRAY